MKKNVPKQKLFSNFIKKVACLFALLLILQANAYAQQRVTGSVSSSTGEALPGVNVTVQGTTIGVMTDMNGNYSIEAPSSQSVLLFSFIGFESQQITVGSQSRINVTLSEDAVVLGDVVVTALGISR